MPACKSAPLTKLWLKTDTQCRYLDILNSLNEKPLMTQSKDTKAKKPISSTSSNKRVGAKQAANRALILDTAEKLMLDEGYAAVSSRRVAKEAGLTPPLVHYYFPTTDDLFLAVYRRAADQELEKLNDALASKPSLQTLWAFSGNANRIALAVEFMALANHRKVIQAEITRSAELVRLRQAEALSTLLNIKAIKPENCSATGLTVLIAGVARLLVMEGGVGISLGHAEASAFVEWWLEHLAKRAS